MDEPGDERQRRTLRHPVSRSLLRPARSKTHTNLATDAVPQNSATERELDAVIADCALYETSGRRSGIIPFDKAAEVARTSSGFVWIGLRQPTAAEFAAVAKEFNLPALAVDDAVRAHQRPKLDAYEDVLFVVLKPVEYVDSEEVVDVSEIAIFVGRRFAITVRHGDTQVLAEVRRELDEAEPDVFAHGPAWVLYRTADRIVDGYEDVAAKIGLDVEDIEAQVFSGDNHDHAERIYKLKREVLEFRRAVNPLATPLQRLADGAIPGIPEALTPFFRDVYDHLLRASDAIEGHDRMLTDVLSADLAQVSVRQNRAAVRQNEDMRKISAWAAIALVPTAIAGIYGMNFENMPELRWKYGYFLVLGVIVAACVGLHRLFRRNGWL